MIILIKLILVLIILIATGVINFGGSAPANNITENRVVTPANTAPTQPVTNNQQLNFCEDYYFTYDANVWTYDNTTSAAGGDQIIQISDGTHTLKYDFNSKPITEPFAQAGIDVSTAQGLKTLYELCIQTSQTNSVGQLGTLTAVDSGEFNLFNNNKLYYAYADLPDSSATTAGDLAQSATDDTTSSGTVVTRYYFIFLASQTDDVVFFFNLKNFDTANEPELHQAVLKILTSITKKVSSVNTNTTTNTSAQNDVVVNEAVFDNSIFENHTVSDNAVVDSNTLVEESTDVGGMYETPAAQEQQVTQ